MDKIKNQLDKFVSNKFISSHFCSLFQFLSKKIKPISLFRFKVNNQECNNKCQSHSCSSSMSNQSNMSFMSNLSIIPLSEKYMSYMSNLSIIPLSEKYMSNMSNLSLLSPERNTHIVQICNFVRTKVKNLLFLCEKS